MSNNLVWSGVCNPCKMSGYTCCAHTPVFTETKEQPVGLSPEQFNSHVDDRLTKTGGMAFDTWSYIRELENKAHGNPTDGSATTDWRDYYDNDYTPHSAIEEDFNYA